MLSPQVSAARVYLRASGATLLGQIIYYAVYFGGIRLVLSTLPKEENGVLTFVQQWTSAIFSITLMSGYTTYLLHRLRIEPHPADFFSTVVWLRFAISIVVSIFLAITFSLVNNIPPSLTIAGSFAALLMSRSITLRATFELPEQINMRFGLLALLNILDIVLIVSMLWWNRNALDAQMVLTIQAIGALPSFIVLLIRTWQQGFLQWTIHRRIVRSLFSEPRMLSMVALLLYLHTLIDLNLLERLGTHAMLGVLGASGYAGIPLNILLGIFWSPLIPLLSQKIHAQPTHTFEKNAERTLRLVTVTIGTVGLVLAALVVLVIELLTSGRYSHYRTEFLLQIWVATFSAIVFAMQNYGSLLERYQIALASVGGLVVGSIFFDWWLIQMHGTIGLLVAKILSHILAISWSAILLLRYGYPVIARGVLQLCLWVLLCGIAVGLTPTSSPLVRVIVFLGIGLITGLITGAIRLSDWSYLRTQAVQLIASRYSAPTKNALPNTNDGRQD